MCQQAAGGDEMALEQLLWLHQARLLGFLRRKVGVDWQGKIEAEDVLQEGYVEICAAMKKFTWTGEDSFYRWATRILDRTFIDRVRSLRRKKRDVIRETSAGEIGGESRRHSLLQQVLRDTATPSRIMRREDAIAAMTACIAKLPEDYRIVVQRLYLDEESLKTIAADLGRTEDAVRRLAGRAVEQLHECMGRATRYLSMRG
jgi:RNA polymerase sigma-70 factor, ECF subfamily